MSSGFSFPGNIKGLAPRLAGPRKWITRAVFDHPDGSHTVVGSRQYRKGIPPHHSPPARDHLIPISSPAAFRKIRCANLSEWIAVLFMVGSACFTVAAFQAAWPGSGFGSLRTTFAQNLTFFIGSWFFTAAAGLQWLQCIRADLSCCHLPRGRRRWFDWRPRDCGYMACCTQFAGTLLFNLNTGDPLFLRGGWLAEDAAVWTPNFLGSILFLVSSVFGCIEAGQKFWALEPRNFSWWIAEINLLGSVFFQASAFLSITLWFALPGWTAFAASLATALGGICFFLAAALMLPEQADEPQHPEVIDHQTTHHQRPCFRRRENGGKNMMDD